MVIQGSTGTPNRHPEVWCPFLSILGAFWESLGTHFGDLFVIFLRFRGAKVGNSFQVHVFDDPGVEMLPDSGFCMCYNHCKNCGFVNLIQ